MTVTDSGRGSRNFILLLTANAVLGAAMPMLIILGGLAGLLLAPSPGLATFPPSVQMLAGLLVAGPMSLFMGRYGRKIGFIFGAMLALLGGVLGYAALTIDNFILLCAAHMALGAALVCFNYFRFAAGEVVKEEWQPVAISLILGSGLIAALIGPEIFNRTKDIFLPIQFAGAYLAISALSLVGIVILMFLRVPTAQPKGKSADQIQIPLLKILQRPAVLTAILTAAVAQGIMVLMMTPTPLAMVGCGFSETSASDVIRWHVVAMFAPSFATGLIIKQYGAMRISGLGLALLSIAAILALTGLSLSHFYGALIILGVGWNFAFIGSTSLLAAAVREDEKARLQGVNDTMIALSSVVCSFASGALVTGLGWSAVGWSILPIISLSAIALLWLSRRPNAETV